MTLPTTIQLGLSRYDAMIRVMKKAIQREKRFEYKERLFERLENILIERFKMEVDGNEIEVWTERA